jgi:hypothetical protein
MTLCRSLSPFLYIVPVEEDTDARRGSWTLRLVPAVAA